ncbi:MAG: hypothetical protein HY225_03465 [Candidatus Vogelbacteria bacterium]|nr:hypothetical protein [Candidatus Vogelbacteria bacterium]
MKMSYRQDNLKKTKNIKVIVVLISIGVLFYFFSEPILSVGFGVLSYVTNPLWRVENDINDTMSSIPVFLRSQQSLTVENRALRAKIDYVGVQLESMDAIRKENQDLIREMGYVGKNDSTVLVSVLTGPNVPPYDSLVVDAGIDSGLLVGDSVLYADNVLIGEVSQVFSHSAKIKLYAGNGVSTDVIISGKESLHAVAEGFGSGNYYIELPSSSLISKGDSLVVPGSNSYLLGVVEYTQIDQTTASQKVLARSPFNIKSARFVRVIKSPKINVVE